MKLTVEQKLRKIELLFLKLFRGEQFKCELFAAKSNKKFRAHWYINSKACKEVAFDTLTKGKSRKK